MQLDIESITDLEQLTSVAKEFLQKRNFTLMQEVADRLFQLKHKVEAIRVYQSIIQNNPEHDYEIEGLGNNQQMIGYYEWDSCAWYKQQRLNKKIKGTPFDGLSLCCMANGKFEAGISWYKQMTNKYPKNYQIRFGYANILYNNGIYEEAIYNYEEVAKLKQNFSKPLVDLALLYEYRRIQKRKSAQKARQVLAIDPNNQYALFILARNQNDIDKKIKLLEQAWKLNVKYTRVCNQIGICYGGTKKQYQQAIKWYQKCTQINAKYSSCYNNIGVNYQLLKRYKQAQVWYFRGVQADCEYKTAYKNLTDIFDQLQYSDDKIIEQSRLYKVKDDVFCYYVGLSYYDKQKVQKSIMWIEKSINLNPNQHRFYNSLAISYDQIKNYDKAIENYKKCIDIQPSYYSAYYNLAIVYKAQNKEEDAIKWYIKATEINPRYSYAYNNLGNIYKNKENYPEAIKYYQKAIEFNSTYTLAYINLGVCHLNLEQYRQAFFAFENAQEIVNTDNNNLSEPNKQFIKPHLQKFEAQRYKWKKFGTISQVNKELLKEFIKQFEESFDQKENYPLFEDQQLKTKQFAELLRVIGQGSFQLVNFRDILQRVKNIYHSNKNILYIVTDYLLQYFWKKKFIDKFSYQDIQSQVQNVIGVQIQSQLSNLPIQKQITDNVQIIEEKLKKYEVAENIDNKVNFFEQTSYFTTYHKLCNEIMAINDKISRQLTSFNNFVNSLPVATVSSSIKTKISQDKTQRYASILSIVQQIFKNQLGDGVKSQITAQIDENLDQLYTVNLRKVAFKIQNTWGDQISQIFLKPRIEDNNQTVSFITDFVQGTFLFATIKQLIDAVPVFQAQCKSFGYEIISFDNQLQRKGQNAIKIILRRKDFTFTVRLELQQTAKSNIFLKELRRIENSPFGSIFECFLSVSRGRRYNLDVITNHITKNIVAQSEQVQQLSSHAKRILENLPTSRKL